MGEIIATQTTAYWVDWCRTNSIPGAFFDTIEVTKAATPDMDGDSIGGSINLKTPNSENGSPKNGITRLHVTIFDRVTLP